MTVRTYDEIVKLVAANNRSAVVSNEVLTCLIWKESGFDDASKNSKSSATGLMQVTRDAVKDVNANTAAGIRFDHGQMSDAATNIQCGTYYLDLRIKRAGNDISKGIDRFGTGSGYAKNILACGECLKKSTANFTTANVSNQQSCLIMIHK